MAQPLEKTGEEPKRIQKLSRMWGGKETGHLIRTKQSYAVITESHMNILQVYDTEHNFIDGCCLSDSIEALKLRAQSSLFKRREYRW
ncbi:MAG: hypothetical protein PVJ67_05490 [Candidatus Pacearchaeota archaeon]|jgi:hypothetical protein